MKLFEASVQEWEWKSSRARLKMSDLEQAKKERRREKHTKMLTFNLKKDA